jgi:HEAT repeat protein
MLELLAIPVALGAGLWAVYESHRSFRMNGREAALACGLRVEETSDAWSGGWDFRARAGPVQVRIAGPHRKGYGPRLVVTAPWPLGFAGIRILSEREKPIGAREVEIGDELFDSEFYVVGPMRLLFALLDAETRRLMIAANAPHAGSVLEIVGGELRADVLYPQMTATLRLLLAIAHRFTQPLDIAQRLAENVRQDRVAGARLGNLLLLARELPGEPGTLEALHTACADASPKVRLRAAQELGAEGRGTLLELAESLVDDAVAAAAVASLRRELPRERNRAILTQALRRRFLLTARVCLGALGGGGGPEDIGTLAKVLALEKSDLAAAAAQALGATGSPAAEPHLLPALAHERLDVRVAAAQALGHTATAAAVLPLKEAAEHTHDRDLRSAIRQAIAEIQSRLQGASPGQLSLAGADVGKLSLAAADAGQLSLAPDAGEAGGQLSLPTEEGSPRRAGG